MSTERRAGEFAQLTDDEVQRIERIVADAFSGFAAAPGTARESGTDASAPCGEVSAVTSLQRACFAYAAEMTRERIVVSNRGAA